MDKANGANLATERSATSVWQNTGSGTLPRSKESVSLNLRTPTRVTDALVEFCASISETEEPGFVEVHPSIDSELNQCFVNAADVARRSGGSVQHGWMVHEWPDVLFEAQFHAVWRQPDGTLVDVSPNDERRIFFLPDQMRVYVGERTPSIQRARSNAAEVLRFIQSCQELWRYEADRWMESEGDVVLDTPFEKVMHRHLQAAKALSQFQLYDMLGISWRPRD
ncbi:MAG TPA: hypothetical protein VGM90_14045 [Kofleriaceae bacterium]|jgi:hypothetical protein